MTLPDWWETILLAAASWRTWHLIALDDITDRPRRYVTDNREGLLEFIECPYCLGFWVAFGWLGLFAAWPTEATWAAVPFVLNTGAILVDSWLSDR